MPIIYSKRPTPRPKSAAWTPEEDEKLLELDKKYNGSWEKIPNGLNRTPVECDLRCFEIKNQKLRTIEEQHKDAERMFLLPEKWDPQPSRSASQLVSKAHKEAVSSLIGNDSSQLGVVAADNSAPRATSEIDKVDDTAIVKLSDWDEKAVELSKEIDQLVKQKESAIQEALLGKSKLEMARERVACLEAVVRGAEERARNAEIAATLLEKQHLLAYINALQTQVQRSIKDVECSDKNLDKPSKRLKISSSSGEGNQMTLGVLTATAD